MAMMGFTLVFIVFVVAAFCAGMILPVVGQAALRRDSRKRLSRFSRRLASFLGFIKSKAGYLASFGAGALLMGLLTFVGQPYTVAAWANVYEEAVLGSLIAADETALQTGRIPQEVLDWYAARSEQ